jgi:hypothetical protein
LDFKNQRIGWCANHQHQDCKSQGALWTTKNGFNSIFAQFASIVSPKNGTRLQVSFFLVHFTYVWSNSKHGWHECS